ncbi:MAG TPA: DUF4386 domain-containing protein [Candidatus Limnocylindrales bacterium]|nr:DUF4386 domain-containing protein [Candidatus Limnocylindrales bacterium]
MTSYRKTALAGGILYLLTFLGSIPAAILVAPAIEPGYITGAGADRQVAFGLVLELVNVLACFGCAVALFTVVRRVHEGLAVGYLATRLFEAATITIGVVSLLALVSLRQQGAADGSAETLTPVASALVAIRNWAIILGPSMAAFNALMLGTALYRGNLVPRWMPALGIFGAPLLITFVIGTILGLTGPGSVFHGIAVFPFFTWELVLGLWLTFKGFNESAPIAVAERERVALAGLVAKGGVA